MIDTSAERRKEEGAKPPFLLTGFTQASGIRTYTFECRIGATRSVYTVEVDLALIPVYGIRIQDLPLLCRELLQLRNPADEMNAMVLTEQRMRSHAEKLTTAREEAAQKKRQPKQAATPLAADGWRPYR